MKKKAPCKTFLNAAINPHLKEMYFVKFHHRIKYTNSLYLDILSLKVSHFTGEATSLIYWTHHQFSLLDHSIVSTHSEVILCS